MTAACKPAVSDEELTSLQPLEAVRQAGVAVVAVWPAVGADDVTHDRWITGCTTCDQLLPDARDVAVTDRHADACSLAGGCIRLGDVKRLNGGDPLLAAFSGWWLQALL